jgi:integrase
MLTYKLIPPGKRGPFWCCRGTLNGRRFEFSCRTADRTTAEAEATAELGRIVSSAIPTEAPVTFAQAAGAYAAFRPRGKLDQHYLEVIVAHIGAQEVGSILHAHLVALANTIYPTEATTGATKNRHVIGPAAAVLHYAAEQGWCGYRRFRRFPEPRKSPRTPVGDDAMAALMREALPHQQAFLAVLYETGLRLGDVMRLTEHALDLRGGAIMAKVSKNGELLRVPISTSLVAMLANLDRPPGDRIFPWPSRWSVYRWLRPLCRKVGIDGYTPHRSRHALATALLERGIPDKQAAEYGAWRDPRSLHRYQHTRPAPLPGRSAGELLEGGKRGKGRKKGA